MRIRNNAELALFLETVERCHMAVWLVAPNGKEYNLKDLRQRFEGLGQSMAETGEMDLEIYASCMSDEMELFGYIAATKGAAA